MDTVTIRDIGPVTEAVIPVAPGVTVLSGWNEAGKSTCIHAVAALAGKDVQLSVRDGCSGGSVAGRINGKGVTIKIGKRRSQTGELDADSLESRLDLAALVEPGLKDTDAANRKRIKSLLTLTGAELKLDDFKAILPAGMPGLQKADAHDDPVVMAGKIKARMETLAREREAEAGSLQAKMAAVRNRLAGHDLDGVLFDADQLAASQQAAIRELAKLEAERDAADKARKASEEAGKQYATMADGLAEEITLAEGIATAHGIAVDHSGEECERLCTIRNELKAKLAEAERACEAATNAGRVATTEWVAACDNVRSIRKREQDAAKFKQLAEAAIPQAPSDAAIDACRAAVDEAAFAANRGAVIRSLRAERGQLDSLQAGEREASQLAAVYRQAACGTDDVLSKAVNCQVLKVVDGELVYREGDRSEPYARLSDGARATIAIREVARAAKNNDRLTILPLAQVFWEGLDGKNRLAVHTAAVESGVSIITAEKGDHPLTAKLWEESNA